MFVWYVSLSLFIFEQVLMLDVVSIKYLESVVKEL